MTKNIASSNASDASQADDQQPPAQAATSASQAGNETPPTTVSPEELLRQIKELRQENANYRRKAKEQEEAANAAQALALAEQGKFKELAEQQATQLAALRSEAEQHTALTQQHAALSALIASQLEEEIKDWPASVKALDPGKDAPIEQRLAWRTNAQAIVAEIQQQQHGQAPGNRPNPEPGTTPEEQQRALLDKMKRRYSRM